MDMIDYALEHEAEKAAWDIWVSVYPGFTKETFVPFSAFKNEQIKVKPRRAQMTNDQIMEEMTGLVKQYEERKRGE